MPFGIQIKGFILGLLAAYFLIPWVQSMLLRARPQQAAA